MGGNSQLQPFLWEPGFLEFQRPARRLSYGMDTVLIQVICLGQNISKTSYCAKRVTPE